MRRQAIAVLTAVAVVSTVVASPVVAQRTSSNVILLNEETERVGQVTVDGQTHTIYRYENSLPYASGIVVYANDREVTSEAEVQAAVDAFARERGAAAIDAETLAALRAVRENVSAAQNVTRRTLAAINETTRRLERTGNETSEGTGETPGDEPTALSRFNSTQAPELRKNLRAWQASAERLRTNATSLVTLLERQQNGTSVDSTALYRQYLQTVHAMETFSERSDTLDEDLTETATASQELAVTVYDAEGSEELALQFVQLSHRLETASDRLATITRPVGERRTTLVEPQETAQATEERLMAAWHSRQGAAMEVYGTLLGVPLALVGIGGVVYWRRQ